MKIPPKMAERSQTTNSGDQTCLVVTQSSTLRQIFSDVVVTIILVISMTLTQFTWEEVKSND